MPLPFSPAHQRFTRQQIALATGVEAEQIAYWIKEGLIKAVEGEGLGKGKPRSFGFEAIHIVALFKELGRYGIQTSGLKQIAWLLWGAIEFCSQHSGIDEEIRAEAAALHRAKLRYPKRSSVPEDYENPNEAYDTFEDWFEDHQPISEKSIEVEPWFDEAADAAFALYFDLFSKRVFYEDHIRWIFAHVGDELVVLPEDMVPEDDREKLPSHLTVNLSLLIKPLWML